MLCFSGMHGELLCWKVRGITMRWIWDLIEGFVKYKENQGLFLEMFLKLIVQEGYYWKRWFNRGRKLCVRAGMCVCVHERVRARCIRDELSSLSVNLSVHYSFLCLSAFEGDTYIPWNTLVFFMGILVCMLLFYFMLFNFICTCILSSLPQNIWAHSQPILVIYLQKFVWWSCTQIGVPYILG